MSPSDAAVLLLPAFDHFLRQEEVRVVTRLLHHVDDAGRPDERCTGMLCVALFG
jgi:hypothetical protein